MPILGVERHIRAIGQERTVQVEAMLQKLCREFTRATGWPLRYEARPGSGQHPRLSSRGTCWRSELHDGDGTAGFFWIEQPARQLRDASFLKACDLADLLVQTVESLLIVEEPFADSLAELRPAGGHSGSAFDITAVLERVIDNALQLTGFRSAGFFMLDPERTALTLRVQKHRDGQVIPQPTRLLAASPFDRRSLDGGILYLRNEDPLTHGWLPAGTSIAVCVPVTCSAGVTGTLWAFDRRSRHLTQRHRFILQSIAARVADILDHAVIRHDLSTSRRIQKELTAASEAGPRGKVRFVSPAGVFEAAGRCTSYGELGGDLLEIIPVNEQKTVLAMGDASGHSIPAAMIMTTVRGSLRALTAGNSLRGMSVAQMMESINRALHGVTRSHQFMTMVCGCLDTDGRTFTYTSAGHPPVLFCRDGTVAPLDSHGMLLGVLEDIEYTQSVLPVRAGDLLVFYTDGLSEAQSRRRQMFRAEGIAHAVARHADGTAQQIVDRIWAEVDHHREGQPSDDDRSLLVVRILSAA